MNSTSKDSGNRREETAGIVGQSANFKLDVGSLKGQIGAMLNGCPKDRFVLGIEQFLDAALAASTKLDKVISEGIEDRTFPGLSDKFDFIIFADVLEHLIDPLEVLRRLSRNLNTDGSIVSSIPNIRHYTLILRLLRSGRHYDDFGLFDRTHLRFCSKQIIIELMNDAGLMIELLKPKLVANKKMLTMNAIRGKKSEEFVATQYSIRARMN